ncbi:hypothetical protein D3C87_1793560 [compost metagenome]
MTIPTDTFESTSEQLLPDPSGRRPISKPPLDAAELVDRVLKAILNDEYIRLASRKRKQCLTLSSSTPLFFGRPSTKLRETGTFLTQSLMKDGVWYLPLPWEEARAMELASSF